MTHDARFLQMDVSRTRKPWIVAEASSWREPSGMVIPSRSFCIAGSSGEFSLAAYRLSDLTLSLSGMLCTRLHFARSTLFRWFFDNGNVPAWITFHSHRMEGNSNIPLSQNIGHRRTRRIDWISSLGSCDLGYGLPPIPLKPEHFFRGHMAHPSPFRSLRSKPQDGVNHAFSVHDKHGDPELLQLGAVPLVMEFYCEESNIYSCPHMSLLRLDADLNWLLRVLVTLHPDTGEVLGVKSNCQKWRSFRSVYSQDKALLRATREQINV